MTDEIKTVPKKLEGTCEKDDSKTRPRPTKEEMVGTVNSTSERDFGPILATAEEEKENDDAAPSNQLSRVLQSLDGGSARRKVATYTQNNTNTE
jgi:hypothetical protein